MADMTDEGVLVAPWRPVFRHSAGRLGSEYLSGLRAGRLLGWKTRNPDRVVAPPKDVGAPGEWVELGPGGTLLGVAPPDLVSGFDEAPAAPFVLSRVLVDGATTPMFGPLKLDGGGSGMPARGARVVVRFLDEGAAAPAAGAGFWFEMEQRAGGKAADR